LFWFYFSCVRGTGFLFGLLQLFLAFWLWHLILICRDRTHLAALFNTHPIAEMYCWRNWWDVWLFCLRWGNWSTGVPTKYPIGHIGAAQYDRGIRNGNCSMMWVWGREEWQSSTHSSRKKTRNTTIQILLLGSANEIFYNCISTCVQLWVTFDAISSKTYHHHSLV
jgi:hypothetical protein